MTPTRPLSITYLRGMALQTDRQPRLLADLCSAPKDELVAGIERRTYAAMPMASYPAAVAPDEPMKPGAVPQPMMTERAEEARGL